MEKLTRNGLRKHNAAVASAPERGALTDRQARELAAGLAAGNQATAVQVRAVESTFRQSRRSNAKYRAGHAHIGADAIELAATVGGATPEPGAHKPNKLEQGAEGHTGAERTAISKAAARIAAKAAERQSFGDGRGAENMDDSENVKTSSADDSGGSQPFTGPRFRQTEATSRGAVEAALEREHRYTLLAWEAFALDYREDCAELGKVLDPRRPNERALRLQDRAPDVAFTILLHAWLKENTRNPQARARRERMFLECWHTWRAYLKRYQRENPYASLPVEGVATRAAPVHLIPPSYAAVASMSAPRTVPQAVRESLPPREVADGIPFGRLGIFRIKPLEEYVAAAAKPLDWGESEARQRVRENTARRDWWNLLKKFRPRSLLETI